MEKNYNIGLDIGVGSVGWCVTDKENNILKKGNKNMWGARIFEEAQTAKERRIFRGTRRRLTRRKERINILQSLMLDDMENEYPNFFPLLKESYKNEEDKEISDKKNGKKYNLFYDFNDENNIFYNDKSYYKENPTIYHLRKNLIENDEKMDIRLVYLAIHHIIKYRGNFLYETEFSDDTNSTTEKFETILQYLKNRFDIELNCEEYKVLEILKRKNISKANKKDELLKLFIYEKSDKQIIVNVINSFLGYVFDLSKIFDIEIEKNKITFSSELENEEEIKVLLRENADIFENMYSIHSWYILQDILRGNAYISEAFVEKYKQYAKDLQILKNIYKKYFKDEYNKMFREEGTNNYVSYNGKNCGESCKKCKPEDFFKALKKKIEKIPDEAKEKQEILNKLADNEFLKKINTTDNGAIPYQLHKKELEIILNNQGKYYKTLNDNKDRILYLMSFRIPYYVGPLSKENGKWSWVKRNSNEKIVPWNFDKVVDTDATAEEFIRRMTNKCTYLINEDVMPKESILYSRFCVLNELNNIRVNNNRLAKDIKNKIINELFMKYKKVTVKRLKDFLKIEGLPHDDIIGVSDGNTFNSSMSAYIDMVNILGKVDESNINDCENIIYWITIFEDKKILKRKISQNYKYLSEEQINKLVKLRYTGWSRLSDKLINGIKSNDGNTILEKLEKTKYNFMQIINNKDFGFKKILEENMPNLNGNIEYKDVEDIPTSPANKRAIWQSICVVKEIKKFMKAEPENIYIEFARNEDKKVMKDNRVKQLLKKYEDIQNQLKELKNYEPKVYKELKIHESDKTLSEKLYLYLLQNGKCLYSGAPLNIDELNSYEVDHILPQSYIKDDSIDNKALVLKKYNQMKKDNMLLEDKIIERQLPWWKNLMDCGLMSQTKFYRLQRRKMFETDADRERFVQRQLVETRQITKYVTNILNKTYKNANVFAIRAELTYGFRTKYNIYKNRNVNNYHHAHDAYIISIIGNIINQHWKGQGEFKYSEYVKKYFKNEYYKKEKYGMIMGFINKHVDIDKIKKVFYYKDCYISRMLEEGTGAFYNQTLYSPKDKPSISLKEDINSAKYGGYSGEAKAYCIVYKYKNSKGNIEYELIGVPIKISYDIKKGKDTIEKYIKRTKLKNVEYSEFEIVINKILKNQEYLDENGEQMRFCSDSEIRANKELVLDEEINRLIYNMNLSEDKLDDDEKEQLKKNYEKVFEKLLEKLNSEYKIFETIYLILKGNKYKFKELKDEEKKATINGLIDLMEKGQGNLKAIGLNDRTGRKSGQHFKNQKLLEMIFINKSVTGIFERRYKINGMENCSCK